MEPRPQSSRSAHEQPQSRQSPSGSGHGQEETGRYQQPPDQSPAPPPRADYDYSPLDLAPPGQRRRRQLVAATLGGLVALLLIAAVIFAFLVLNDGDDEDLDIAALQTQTAATIGASTPDTSQGGALADLEDDQAVDATAPADTSVEDTDPAQDDATTTVDEAGDQAAPEPTTAEQNTNAGTAGGGPSQQVLEALLPSQEIMPQGLEQGEDASRTQEQVAAELGGNREAEMNLENWGWSGNVVRSFTAPDPAALSADATTDITVSLHGFANDASAAEALTFYSDILAGLGYDEVEVGDIGGTNRMLVQPQEDGGTTVALYVQDGPVLYRIGGYSPAGDPSDSVINVAQSMIGQ